MPEERHESDERRLCPDAEAERSYDFEVRLYVFDSSPLSIRAIRNVTSFLESALCDQFHLTIIDIEEHPEIAERDGIVAVPALIKVSPPPRRGIVGDMSNTELLRAGFDLADDA